MAGRVRIVCESGKFFDAHVFTDDGGREIYVREVTIRVAAMEPIKADMSVYLPRLDVLAEAGRIEGVCPHCGHQKDLQLEDVPTYPVKAKEA